MSISFSKLFSLCLCLLISHSLFAKESPENRKSKKEPVELSNSDRRILENGEIGGFRHAAGSIIAVIPGFGLGHAVQGRYLYKGLVFTLTELGCVAVAAGVRQGGLEAVVLPFLGFKIWEFVDSIVGPIRNNRRYNELQSLSLEQQVSPLTILPVPLVKQNESGKQSTHLGLALTWNIP